MNDKILKTARLINMNASNVYLELCCTEQKLFGRDTKKRNIEALKNIIKYADNLIKDLEELHGTQDK